MTGKKPIMFMTMRKKNSDDYAAGGREFLNEPPPWGDRSRAAKKNMLG